MGKHQNLWCSGLACPRAYGNAGSREALGTRMDKIWIICVQAWQQIFVFGSPPDVFVESIYFATPIMGCAVHMTNEDARIFL